MQLDERLIVECPPEMRRLTWTICPIWCFVATPTLFACWKWKWKAVHKYLSLTSFCNLIDGISDVNLTNYLKLTNPDRINLAA